MGYDHKSEEFMMRVLPIIRGVSNLRSKYNPAIRRVSRQITQLKDKKWEEDLEIVELWFLLKQATLPLSDHPHDQKRVGAIYVDRRNRMQAWAVNQVPDGMPRYPEFYMGGIRRHFIACAERIGGAKILQVRIPRNAKWLIKKASPNDRLSVAYGILRELDADIIAAALKVRTAPDMRGQSLRGSQLIVGAPCCDDCKPFIRTCWLDTIHTDLSGGVHFTRATELENPQSLSWGKRTKINPLSLRQ
jgi:hypothetical protein